MAAPQSSFKTGQRVKIVGMTSGHCFFMGQVVTLYGNFPAKFSNTTLLTARSDSGICYNVYCQDIEPLPMTKADYEAELELAKKAVVKAQAEVSRLDSILEIMATEGCDELNDTTLKAYLVLKQIDKGASKIETARAIASIIENN